MATQLVHEIDPSDAMWVAIEHAALHDDGAAAQSHLDAGRAIFYREPDTPAGIVIKHYPDGHRELVRFDGANEVVVRPLA